MNELESLYRDVVKQTRVLRNVSNSHKAATGLANLSYEHMTGYERGRLTRAAQKLSYTIWELIDKHDQWKVAFVFMAYLDGIGTHPGGLAANKINYWPTIDKFRFNLEENGMVDYEQLMRGVPHVASILDVPLADAAGRIMLMKLSI